MGLGPYRFVRLSPGAELVLEANEAYWRKKPTIKQIVIKRIPDPSTRLSMLNTGEADIAYLLIGIEAQTVQADPRLRLVKTIPPATWYVDFPEQWQPKSPWHARCVRLAAFLALDKQAILEPATLHAVGPRVAEPAIGLNTPLFLRRAYEEMRLKKQ